MKINFIILFLTFLFSQVSIDAQTRTSVSSGSFNDPNIWNCTCIPANSDDIIISNGDSVTLASNTVVASLEIETGALLDNNGRRININGNYIVNGIHTGSGNIRLFGFKSTIDGSGIISNGNNFDIRNDSIRILSTASISKTGGGSFRIRGARTFVNEGQLTVTRNITGNNAISTFYNAVGANLLAGRNIMNTGILIASDLANNITYNRSGNQTVKTPLNAQYYNLSFSGTGNKNVGANLIVKNDVSLLSGNFRLRGNDLDIKGDYINTGGVFVESTGIVSFNGNSTQSIVALTNETFFDLLVDSGTVLTSFVPLTISNNLNVFSPSILDMNDTGSYQLNIQGNLLNSGTINFYQNELLLDGSNLQSINGSISPYNLIINNASGIQISSGITSVRNLLDINSGLFNTNNQLLFISDTSGTAALADLTGGGTITGNVTIQRYLNESANSFFYMVGSGVSGATLSDWNNDLTTHGFPGADFPNNNFISVYKYLIDSVALGGNYSEGYTAPNNLSEALNASEGWMVWHSGGPITISSTGPFNTGNINTGALGYNTNPTGGDSKRGWHLRSNPYASPIDWLSVTKSNVSNSGEAYVSKPDGNYWSVNADNIDNIYSGEAYWIKVNSGGGSLSFNENDKALVSDNFNARVAQNTAFDLPLKMLLTYNGINNYSDYSVLRFGGDSNSVNFDNVFGEAYKVPNSYGNRPNIASISAIDSVEVYYNNLSPLDSSWTIPLKIWKSYPANRRESYKIEFNGIEQWNKNNHCLILSDSLSSIALKLDQNNGTYTWSAYDTFSNPYIYLHHSMPLKTSQSDISCVGENDGNIRAMGNSSNGGKHDYLWYDSNGNTLKFDSNSAATSVLENLKPGTYYVDVSDNGQCGTMTQTFILTNPEPIIPKFSAPAEADLNGDPVQFENNSYNATYYFWDFGDGSTSNEGSPSHKFNSAGEFLVQLKAFQNETCFNSYSQLIRIRNYSGVLDMIEEPLDKEIYSYDNKVFINIELKYKQEVFIEIYNMMGQKIIAKQYRNTDQLNEQIEMLDSEGVFVVRIKTLDQEIRQKILIK